MEGGRGTKNGDVGPLAGGSPVILCKVTCRDLFLKWYMFHGDVF